MDSGGSNDSGGSGGSSHVSISRGHGEEGEREREGEGLTFSVVRTSAIYVAERTMEKSNRGQGACGSELAAEETVHCQNRA